MFKPLNAPLLVEEIVESVVVENEADDENHRKLGEDEIMVMYSQALLMLGEKKFSEAETELVKLKQAFSLRKSRREHKLKLPVLMNMAECYTNLGKIDLAVNTLREVCNIQPNDATPWFKLGCLLIKAGSIYEAIQAFREAVTHCQGVHWAALTRLCQCLYVLGLFDECIFFCLHGLSENSCYSTAHTLLLEMIKLEKNITHYNLPLREKAALLDKLHYKPSVIAECNVIRRYQDEFIAKRAPVTPQVFTPDVKLKVHQGNTCQLSDICCYLASACDEAIPVCGSNNKLDFILKVQNDEVIPEDPVPGVVDQTLPTTPQQTTRLSRLSAQNVSKLGNQPSSVTSMRIKLLKYVAQLKLLMDPEEFISQRKPSLTLINSQSSGDDENKRLAEVDISDDLEILMAGTFSLRYLAKHFLERMAELSGITIWEKGDAVGFCLLYYQFRRYTKLQPFNSIKDTENMAICNIIRIFLETVVDFLEPGADRFNENIYQANFAYPSVSIDLSDEIDCITLPNLICHSLKTYGTVEERCEKKIRHCLLFFRLSKVSHNFNLMQMASSGCRSAMQDLPEFSHLYLGHVWRHPLWKRQQILMEMKWTHCYELLRGLSDVFEAKNWESICAKLASPSPECGEIFDVSNFDLLVSSDLAHYALIYAEALLRCHKPDASAFLINVLAFLMEILSSNRTTPISKILMADAWGLCKDHFDVISSTNRSSLMKILISSTELIFTWIDNNAALPFDCRGFFSCLFLSFPLLEELSKNDSTTSDFLKLYDPNLLDADEVCSNHSFDSDEDSDFAKLPYAIKVIIMLHDVLATSGGGICRTENCSYLEFMRNNLVAFLMSDASKDEGMTKGARVYVERQIEQCVICQLGITLRRNRGKATMVIEHPNKPLTPQELTWATGISLFEYYKPREMPAYDSYNRDSVSSEFAVFLKKLMLLCPVKPVLEESELNEYLLFTDTEGAKAFHNRVRDMVIEMSVDREHYANICYLLADHTMKDNNFADALKYYKQAIIYEPKVFDAWAGMAISWQSSISDKLDECDTDAQCCSPELIQPVMRTFQVAHVLQIQNGKLLMEYASFALEIYSLIRRVETAKRFSPKRRSSGDLHLVKSVVETFVGKSPASDRDLLNFVYDLFKQANASPDIDPPSDRWFCLFMIGKLGGKLGESIVHTIEHFVKAFELLFEHEAIFPGSKIVSSQAKDLHFTVECFECFYRLHAEIIKYFSSNDTQARLRSHEQEQTLVIKSFTKALHTVYQLSFSKTVMPVFSDFPASLDGLPNLEKKAQHLVEICIHAMIYCSSRFPELFKSRHRLARAFFNHSMLKNMNICGHVLLGWPLAEECEESQMTAFSGVKFGAPLFQVNKIQSSSPGSILAGFWRSTHPDFDRRGSFFNHTFKCVYLLLDFLRSCSNNPEALKLLLAIQYQQLGKQVSASRKYLRESDQSILSAKSMEYALEMMNSSISLEVACPREKLFDVYRLEQAIVRSGRVSLLDKAQSMLIRCYCSSGLGSESKAGDDLYSPPTIAEVERFCEKQIIIDRQVKLKAEKAEKAAEKERQLFEKEKAIVEVLLKSMVESIEEPIESSVIADVDVHT